MTDGLRRLEIDNQLEMGRLLDWNVGRLGAAQYFNDHPRPLPVELRESRTVARKTALFRHFRPLVYGRQSKCRDMFENATAVDEKKRRRQKIEPLGSGCLGLVDRRHNFLRLGNANN